MSERTRRTRIVATLGPATCSPASIRRIVRSGVDIVRLNFSHGSHEFHAQLVRDVRQVAAELGQHVAILQDLSGPKMRVGRMDEDAARLRTGSEVLVVEGHGVGTAEQLFVEAAGVVRSLEPGRVIRLADGQLELRVVARADDGVVCRVVHGGTLRSRQGVNVPGLAQGVKALTRKDRKDLEFGLSLGVDAVALSFVQDASDVVTLRKLLARHGARPFVVAKIERAGALDNLDAILDVTGGVMVARGDLGVEIGVEKVPMAQKHIIRRARAKRRPVITATQMLESMIERPTPTRAEVSDVANAVLEGTDALMLSGETAVGRYPVEAVRTLANVAMEAEHEIARVPSPIHEPDGVEDPSQAVTRAARVAARAVGARAVLGFTNSGRTARLVSSMRPTRAVFGFTYVEATARRMKFFWGVTPMMIHQASTVAGMIEEAEALLVAGRLVKKGDRLVIVCGQQVTTGATNSIHIHTVDPPRGRQARAK
ncbi:MAG: pyruvate kinase [Planctomycetes bacterium]|nr:pyruvate kinase [Planctomycetota bacterium]